MLHPAVKCVVSHGGFGTMIEGFYAGQPFITSPVASDQFIDARVLRHLGISLGTIALNLDEDVMTKGRLIPNWPNDGGKEIRELFARVFGTAEGGVELERARASSRALRKRLADAKTASAAQALDNLRRKFLQS